MEQLKEKNTLAALPLDKEMVKGMEKGWSLGLQIEGWMPCWKKSGLEQLRCQPDRM